MGFFDAIRNLDVGAQSFGNTYLGLLMQKRQREEQLADEERQREQQLADEARRLSQRKAEQEASDKFDLRKAIAMSAGDVPQRAPSPVLQFLEPTIDGNVPGDVVRPPMPEPGFGQLFEALSLARRPPPEPRKLTEGEQSRRDAFEGWSRDPYVLSYVQRKVGPTLQSDVWMEENKDLFKRVADAAAQAAMFLKTLGKNSGATEEEIQDMFNQADYLLANAASGAAAQYLERKDPYLGTPKKNNFRAKLEEVFEPTRWGGLLEDVEATDKEKMQAVDEVSQLLGDTAAAMGAKLQQQGRSRLFRDPEAIWNMTESYLDDVLTKIAGTPVTVKEVEAKLGRKLIERPSFGKKPKTAVPGKITKDSVNQVLNGLPDL